MRLISRVALVVLTICAPSVIWPPPAVATTHSITISGYAFRPSALTITAGDTVVWSNQDQAPHDVTTTEAPVTIHGTTLGKGQSWRYTFTTPGTYFYICSIHPDMKATLTVVAAVAPTHAPARAAVTSPVRSAQRTRVHTVQATPAPRRTRTGTRHPAATTPSTAAAGAPVVQSAASTPGTDRRLRPLLIVAGIVAAVATLALLMLASRPEDG